MKTPQQRTVGAADSAPPEARPVPRSQAPSSAVGHARFPTQHGAVLGRARGRGVGASPSSRGGACCSRSALLRPHGAGDRGVSPLLLAPRVQDVARVPVPARAGRAVIRAEGRAVVGRPSPPPSQALRQPQRHPFGAPAAASGTRTSAGSSSATGTTPTPRLISDLAKFPELRILNHSARDAPAGDRARRRLLVCWAAGRR